MRLVAGDTAVTTPSNARPAAIDSVNSVWRPTEGYSWHSLAVVSRGEYGAPEGLQFGFPVRSTGDTWSVVEGIEHADSIIVNPHKWLFTPIDFSAFYCRRPEVLRQAFALVPEYLKTNQDNVAVNLMDYGIPLGRRFRALKLWFLVREQGVSGMQARLRRDHRGARGELRGRRRGRSRHRPAEGGSSAPAAAYRKGSPE